MVDANIPFPFRTGCQVRSSPTTPTLHSTSISCIHFSTAQHKYSFSHSIYSVPLVVPMPFSYPFPAVAFLPAASLPQKQPQYFPHHPIVVQLIINSVVYTCACGICVPFSLHYVPGAVFVPQTDSRYYITLSLQTYTSAPTA